MLLMTVFPTAGNASGWVCIEGRNGLLQKYEARGAELVAVDDPFTMALGGQGQRWTVMQDTAVGIVAVFTEAKMLPTGAASIAVDTMLIDKATGRMRRVAGAISGSSTAEGQCVRY